MAGIGRVTADDRDAVNSVVEDLGLHGALRYAYKRLPEEPKPHIRRIMILIIRETAMRLLHDVRRAKRLASAHMVGLRTIAEAETPKARFYRDQCGTRPPKRVRRLTR